MEASPSPSPPSSLIPAGSARPFLAVVIVNYRSWGDVARLVTILSRSPAVVGGAAEILVVDNASRQAVPPSLVEPIPGVRLILRESNDGFAAGVNAGWQSTSAPWLLVLNPDLVAEPDLPDRVLTRIAARASEPTPRPLGVVGFALRNPDGSRQPSVGVFPSLGRTLREQVIPRSRRQYQPDRRVRPGPVDWVTGACFLVASRLLADLGGMDEDFFLYYEEVALCRAATRAGWAVEYDPSVAVVHLRPLQNRAISTRMRLVTRHSKLLYFRKHLPSWQFAALRWVVRAESAIRSTWSQVQGQGGVATWRAVGEIARRIDLPGNLRGRAIRDLADAVSRAEGEAEAEATPDDEIGPRARTARTRHQARPRHRERADRLQLWHRLRSTQPIGNPRRSEGV